VKVVFYIFVHNTLRLVIDMHRFDKDMLLCDNGFKADVYVLLKHGRKTMTDLFVLEVKKPGGNI